jgi:hypothetical protein
MPLERITTITIRHDIQIDTGIKLLLIIQLTGVKDMLPMSKGLIGIMVGIIIILTTTVRMAEFITGMDIIGMHGFRTTA